MGHTRSCQSGNRSRQKYYETHEIKDSFKPILPNSATPPMAAIRREAEHFNNCLGFERGLSQRQSKWFAHVPERRVFGLDISSPDKA
jgi:hypothetical protein